MARVFTPEQNVDANPEIFYLKTTHLQPEYRHFKRHIDKLKDIYAHVQRKYLEFSLLQNEIKYSKLKTVLKRSFY